MSSGALLCDGTVTVTVEGAPLCSGVWRFMAIPEPFDPSQLQIAELAQMFTYGFGLVGLCCVLGIVGRLLLSSIYNPSRSE